MEVFMLGTCQMCKTINTHIHLYVHISINIDIYLYMYYDACILCVLQSIALIFSLHMEIMKRHFMLL